MRIRNRPQLSVGANPRSVRKIFNSYPWEGCGWISWWQGGVYTSFQANKSVNETPSLHPRRGGNRTILAFFYFFRTLLEQTRSINRTGCFTYRRKMKNDNYQKLRRFCSSLEPRKITHCPDQLLPVCSIGT
ncbi:hypothetical protein SAMN03159284_01528 [Mucilaginibacter sp. NFR10]|nr:hypothetical protein SAMN03159284_01528 [Mucilaginibacter sp. NFR10]